MKTSFPFLLSLLFMHMLCSCNGQNNTMRKGTTSKHSAEKGNYAEGKDYFIYERVRMLDKTGFSQPQEAYSLLLPKGWQHQDEIIWNTPGSSCEGTFRQMSAKSSDGNAEFELFPDIIYIWNTNQEMMQFYQNNPGNSAQCSYHEPMQAEEYLRNVFVAELGNPEILEVKPNADVVRQMAQLNEENMSELRQYGAGQMQFYQTAINANVRWQDGKEGWVVLGVSILEMVVPNVYNGSYNKIYTSQVTNRTVFKYSNAKKEQAENQFSIIMASFRTNPAWNSAVKSFWRNVRQQKNIEHIGKIRMMDERTRQIGEQAIRNGNQRLNDMDQQMRSWEQQQSSQDRMHTAFIKTIRGVENYQDENGKYEMSSGYEHAWSRGDGSSFIMSNNPNFDPSSVLQDQRWKEMKKVE